MSETAIRASSTSPKRNPAVGYLPATQFAKWVAEVEGKPDAAQRVQQFLAQQKAFPIVEGARVAHFVYVGDEDDVVLRGDMLELGQDLPMRRVAGSNLHYASFELAPDARIAYQFMRKHGEAIADARNPLRGAAFNIAGDVSLLLMPRAPRTLPIAAPNLRGKKVELEIENTPAQAETLRWGGKRKVTVYLPAGYDADASKRYPTLYVYYGQQMTNDGHLDALIDRAIGQSLQPFIAVFINSTNAYEYARTFRAVHHRMMAEQMVPWIDGQFRTLADPAHRIILGDDEGGFGALETVLLYSKVFGGAIAQSAYHLSGGDGELLELVDRSANKSQQFYLDWGMYDGRRVADEVDIAGFTRKVYERMKAKGYRVKSQQFPDGSATLFFTERLLPALRMFFPSN